MQRFSEKKASSQRESTSAVAWASCPCVTSQQDMGRMPMPRSVFNKVNRFVIAPAVAGLIAAFAPLHAQQQTSSASTATPPTPLPPGPWLKRAPEPSQWIVTFSNAPAPKKQASSSNQTSPGGVAQVAKKIVVTKNKDTLKEQTIKVDGSSIDVWRMQEIFFTKLPWVKDWIISPNGPPNNLFTTDYSKVDFAGFDWISEKNYAGMVLVANRKCLVFRGKTVTTEPMDLQISNIDAQTAYAAFATRKRMRDSVGITPDDDPNEEAPAPFNPNDHKMDATAAIDAETGLPVQLVYATPGGIVTRAYQFLSAPATPLALPADAQTAFNAQSERMKRLSRPPAIP